jgi:Domain of unknown function (DUF4412)
MRLVYLSAVVLSVAALASAEDLTIVSRVTKGEAKPEIATSYYTSSKMRVSEGNGREMIADFASGTMTGIDHTKREYNVITQADLDAMMAQSEARSKEMDAKMQNMPPAVREKMAAMMGDFAASVEVKKGTGGRTIAGYSCENWIVTMGKMMTMEHCVSSEISVPPAMFDAMKRMMSSMAAAGPAAKGMNGMWDKFKEMKGFPLATKTTMNIMGRSDTTLKEATEVKKGPVPAAVFDIPAGYKKVDSPMAKMNTGGKK